MQNLPVQLPLPPARNKGPYEKSLKNSDSFSIKAPAICQGEKKEHTEKKDRWKLKPDKTLYGPLAANVTNSCSKLLWWNIGLFKSWGVE